MKRLVLIFMLCLPVISAAQEEVFDFDKVSYFGIDFSKVKIMGANESDADFHEAFERINMLVLGEPKKYNLPRAFGKTVFIEDLGTVISRSTTQIGDLRTTNPGYMVTEDEMHEIVDAYRAEGDTGYGLVIAGEFLNKPAAEGSFVVMFFDRSNGDIVYYKRASGKAAGFGLRNYWASSLYNVLKKWRY